MPAASQAAPQPPPPSVAVRARPSGRALLAFALALHNLLIGVLAAYAIADLLLDGGLARALLRGFGAGEASLVLARHLLLTVLGAVLGSALHSLFGLWVHACVLEDFSPAFTGSYLLGAFAAGLLGVGTFLVLQGGMLALGGDPAGGAEPLRASLFHGAIGVLVGLGFDAVLMRIDGVTRELFGAPEGSFMRSAIRSAQKRLAETPDSRDGTP